jgi:hypothetical protein
MINTIDELIAFLDERLKVHADIKKEMHDKGDYSADEYRQGSVNAYEVVRYEITGKNR